MIFLSNKIIRRFVLFSVTFVATRDIWVALTLTAVFIVLVSGIFNENYLTIEIDNLLELSESGVYNKNHYITARTI